ncbi:methyltransferase domain-containing protein, partial [Schumannella luteola]
MTTLRWMSRVADSRCRACGFGGEGTRVLDFDTPLGAASATRCARCGSVMLLDEILGSSPDDATVDDYVLTGAGIGTIAALVDELPGGPGTRMLDVGCGYGFAGDFARWRHGWDVTGVEPSYAGVRGARDLALDIRDEPLSSATEVGDPFDVILSSEVLEHVTDPLGFLREIAARLAEGGLLVMTTPDAALIAPDADPDDVVSALSPGYHVFLASRDGLEALLTAAGFTEWRITRTRVSHEIVARMGPGPLPRLHLDASPATLVDYLRERADEVPAPVLRSGLLSRATRELVARGRFDEAREIRPALRAALLASASVDIDGDGPVTWPDGLAGCAFALGMAELLDGDPSTAVVRFDQALDAVSRRRSIYPVLDLDTIDIDAQARYHRLLALARADPATVAAQVPGLRAHAGAGVEGELRHAMWTARIFVELTARGELDAARPLLADVDQALELLSTAPSPDAQLARSDARLCRASFEVPPVAVPISHHVDVFWSDTDSTFVSGWFHHDGDPGEDATVHHRGARVPLTRVARPDLELFWPDAQSVAGSGFDVMLEGPAPAELTVEWRGADGTMTAILPLPPERRPAVDLSSEDWTELAGRIAAAPPGPVLLLGARRSHPELPPTIAELVGDREVVGVDIHPGLGVDLVADVHRLSAVVDPGTFPIVLSGSLLEHVEAPWLVAHEIARILPPDGLAVHAAPWVWPSHAEPNDFWRF